MANLKLNQVIALEKGTKAHAEGALTRAYHDIQKTGPMSGIARTYKPRDDEGDQLPPESTKLQLRVEDTLDEVSKQLARLFDLTVTKDAGNQKASANVSVNGVVVLTNVPVTTLLTLEKKLIDLQTFISKLPVLDPAEEWEWDENVAAYATPVTKTVKTKKIPRNHVLAAATDKHPAQVQIYHEDVPVGDWSTVKFSGAVTQTRQNELYDHVVKLHEAVQKAREEANVTEVPDVKIGEAIFSFLGW